ncbi:hypothetical protein TELCIR_09382, partial [Teladorsagia circumcincta]
MSTSEGNRRDRTPKEFEPGGITQAGRARIGAKDGQAGQWSETQSSRQSAENGSGAERVCERRDADTRPANTGRRNGRVLDEQPPLRGSCSYLGELHDSSGLLGAPGDKNKGGAAACGACATNMVKLTFKTAYCTNAMSALSAAGIEEVTRLERTIRYQFDGGPIPDDDILLEIAGDRMTECIYTDQIDFTPIRGREKVLEIDVLGDPTNLDKANDELGLAFDAHDLLYYKDLFANKFKRNPTDVELFDLAQSDSEHSRHWFFRGSLIIDGKQRK